MKIFTIKEHRRTSGRLIAIAMAAVMVAWAPASVADNFGDQMVDTFKNGEFDVNFRYRYEFVDQDGMAKDANASTLRTRLVFRTAKWNDLDVTLNMDDVHTIVASNYNSTRNGQGQYPTVADPKGTNLNIAALTYSGLKDTTIVGGRQRIIRGNARFIGNVGWRQNEQTYDALSANYKGGNFSANYAYLDQVNRIFGPESGTGKAADVFRSDSHIIDAAYTLNGALSVSVYGYLLDLDDKSGLASAHNNSNETYGVRISGAPKIGDGMAITYAAEYATQKDYEDSALDYDTDYMLGELGFKWNQFSIKAGYEVLESDNGVGFKTPLATLHAHNGWADQFLGTPANGLEDTYIAASAKVSKGTLKLVLHDFSSDVGSIDYGTEIDFLAKWPLGKHYSVLGKIAMFDADDDIGGNDITKAWLMLTAAF